MRVFQEHMNVSRETLADLEIYEKNLVNWTKKTNLIGKSTIKEIWTRHFLDSAQIIKYLPKLDHKTTIVDFGSGAGFPGLVLATLLKKNKKCTFYIIEKSLKKSQFLTFITNKLKLNAKIYAKKAENINNLKADIIISRAFAPLSRALQIIFPYCKKNTVCYFYKGQNVDTEIELSTKYWDIDSMKKIKSITSSEGTILKLLNYKKRTIVHYM